MKTYDSFALFNYLTGSPAMHLAFLVCHFFLSTINEADDQSLDHKIHEQKKGNMLNKSLSFDMPKYSRSSKFWGDGEYELDQSEVSKELFEL